MAIRVALHHQTAYRYDRPVTLGAQTVRLRPAPHCRTPIVSYSMKIANGPGEPEPFINWQQDPQANYLARLVFPQPVTAFRVDIDLVADMTVINPFDFFLEEYAEEFPFVYSDALARELRPYLETLGPEGCGPLFEQMLVEVDRRTRRTVEFLVDLNQSVERRLRYSLRYDPGVQSPEQTLESGVGSCRDFAWLLVQLLRRSGLAARFVSGYSVQLVADQKPIEDGAAAGVAEDVTDLHAWAEVFLPGAGWVGLDATSGMMCGEGHIPLACSPDPGSAAPITGSLGAAEVKFDYSMSVTRLHEDPRVTKPYTDTQWEAIDRLGREVDRRLEAGDVRLTMGGEPTFVSIDDQEGATWNTAAVGGGKRGYAERLVRGLREAFAPGSLLHVGQGKWYPGEPLPRWALGIYWRRDGKAVWGDDRWIADESRDYGAGPDESRRLLRQILQVLHVEQAYIKPALEDRRHYETVRDRLPVNLTPQDNQLENEQDRARLKHVFERGLETPVGYVVPLSPERQGDAVRWRSGRWLLPPDAAGEGEPAPDEEQADPVTLIPGDSPVGLRLPLETLPWVEEKDRPVEGEIDPTEAAGRPLEVGTPDAADDDGINPADRPPAEGESAGWIIRSALCVEPRDGRLYVFMPPTRRLEDYLQLLNAVESAAAALEMPVVIEGYTPPNDPRLLNIKVTPDPGVIEVNIHPTATWGELSEVTQTLYDLARRCRLGTEKFQLDGRHTGTGGGNHVVVGAAKPLDSPFLRRPDLLRSLLGHWLDHPSLSYLFSGMFVGPTSQAPRVDEGRPEATYELEIAFRQVSEAHGGKLMPWTVDRVFRHLLTDLTGNTHRAEFCIDKLYSPDSATGRLGLVEFRGFEMPPHPQMALTQALLLRALIARFWETPAYSAGQPLTRWGTALHDRYMLPHFIEADFGEVLGDLQQHGYDLQPAWYDAFFEFRFPRHGTYECDGITLELRQAIEPWLTLGEEATGQGTARYVDSSLERMQVKVTGLAGEVAESQRYAVAVNGRELPLTPTGRKGEFVAGVRYRAWQPWSCLHPTIPVHTPLVFDLFDKGVGRAIGGCRYHVSHPGGTSYESFPVNALEAEARRHTRFTRHGHTPGGRELRPTTRSLEMPVTLDLRR
jgi:uncharacterized protein (DUF2126 family)